MTELRAACTGKDRFTSKGDALKALESVQRRRAVRRRVPWQRLHAYRCKFCSFWHLGSG